jgi:hypothetical protein
MNAHLFVILHAGGKLFFGLRIKRLGHAASKINGYEKEVNGGKTLFRILFCDRQGISSAVSEVYTSLPMTNIFQGAVMRSAFFLFLFCSYVVLLASGCAAHRRASAANPVQVSVPAPVVISDSIRESLPGDYLRVSFLAPGTPVTNLSRPGALRAFTTATALYSPPLKLADMPNYSGLVNNDEKMLVAMRCRPPHPEAVDAVLATWPNVFLAVQRDVPLNPGVCDATPTDPATQMACFARAFSDPAATEVPSSLARTFNYAAKLYDGSKLKPLVDWLKNNYGIYPAFSGMGYSVKDSYSLDKQPMSSQQVLVKSVSSEYILKNVSLAEAGCRCISVAPYPGRSNDPVDPDFIAQAGGDGTCKTVDRLAARQGRHKH